MALKHIKFSMFNIIATIHQTTEHCLVHFGGHVEPELMCDCLLVLVCFWWVLLCIPYSVSGQSSPGLLFKSSKLSNTAVRHA